MNVYRARWVLPISSPPIANGAVAEEGGRLTWVGPAARAPTGNAIDLGDAVLLPGLVNAHTHLELTTMRGFLEELAFQPWIRRVTIARRDVLDEASLLDAARLGIAEGIRAGITTYADTGFSGTPAPAMRELGVRGLVFHEVFGPAPEEAESALGDLRARATAARANDTPLVRTGVSPHAPYTVSDALFRATAAFAREASFPIAVHIAESAAEDALVRDGTGPFADMLRRRKVAVSPRAASPLALLAASGVLDLRPLLIHCVRASETDRALMALHDCAVAHCPVSNAKLGHGIAPLLEMMRAGLRVGLGTDSVASNNRMDLLDEARQSSLFARALAGAHEVLPASHALALATIGSARALDLAGEVGTLEPGKAADLAAFTLDDARTIPAFDPCDALVWAVAGRAATFVAVAGRVLLEGGVLSYDDAAVRVRVSEHAVALARWRDEVEDGAR